MQILCKSKVLAKRESISIFILDNPILMMHANGAKCYLLILPVDLIQKYLVGKSTIISVVMLYNAIFLGQNLFKSFTARIVLSMVKSCMR